MTMRSLSLKVIAVPVIIVAVAAVYFFVDPSASRWVPKCAFHEITGYDCPGCGSQRMLHALLHGDFAAAWHANAFIICAAPLLVLMLCSAALRARYPRLYAWLNSPLMIAAITLSLLLWTVLRNLL